MRTSLFLLFSLLLPLSLTASNPWLKRPLKWVSADSVVTWEYDDGDFRSLAKRAYDDASPYNFRLTRRDWKEKKNVWKEWNNGAERLNRVGGLGDELTEPQTLSAVTWMSRAASLFLMQGDAAYIDCIERSLYNAVMHSVRDTLGGELGMERRVAANVLCAAPGLMYATDDEGILYVNLFANSTAGVTVGNRSFTVDQVTSFPLDGRVRIRLTKVGDPFTFRICVRMPDWTGLRHNAFTPYIYSNVEKAVLRVYVNGHEIEPLAADKKGWVTIERKWKSMDEVYIDFPLYPYYFRPAETKPSDALLRGQTVIGRGPQVFVTQTPADGCYYSLSQPLQIENELDENGNVVISGKMFRDADAPQDAKAPEVPFKATVF